MEWWVWVILGVVALVAFVAGALVVMASRSWGEKAEGVDDLSKTPRTWTTEQYPPHGHSELKKPHDY